MTTSQRVLILVNVLGGVAVLGSYALGITTHASPAEKLWGATPTSVRGLYTASMLLAAVGYLLFLHHLVFRADPALSRLPGGPAALTGVFLLVLVPSALWMSLTFHFAENPSPVAWWAVRGVLFLVALGSLALVGCLILLRPAPISPSWALAMGGAVMFAFHTTLLDALLWPVLYPA